MRIDYNYISEILSVFLDSDEPVVWTLGFQNLISADESKFFFHLVILAEKGIISSALSGGGGIGIQYSGHSDEYNYSDIPLRLTADGHDFAGAITKPDVIEIIATRFKQEGLSAVVGLAKKIAVNKAEKVLEDVLA